MQALLSRFRPNFGVADAVERKFATVLNPAAQQSPSPSPHALNFPERLLPGASRTFPSTPRRRFFAYEEHSWSIEFRPSQASNPSHIASLNLVPVTFLQFANPAIEYTHHLAAPPSSRASQQPVKMSEQVDLKTIPISPEGGNVDSGPAEDPKKLVTVFHDKDNFNVKHPLSNRWTLWFTKPASGKVCTLCCPAALVGQLTHFAVADRRTRATTGMTC
jgi:hypothetical protein